MHDLNPSHSPLVISKVLSAEYHFVFQSNNGDGQYLLPGFVLPYSAPIISICCPLQLISSDLPSQTIASWSGCVPLSMKQKWIDRTLKRTIKCYNSSQVILQLLSKQVFGNSLYAIEVLNFLFLFHLKFLVFYHWHILGKKKAINSVSLSLILPKLFILCFLRGNLRLHAPWFLKSSLAILVSILFYPI